MRRRSTVFAAGLLLPEVVHAHASEGGFVLLLPTDLYVAGGSLVVALTVGLLAIAPSWRPETILRPVLRLPCLPSRLRPMTQALALAILALMLWSGAFGPTDPLRNPMTLGLWTVFWIGLVGVQALVFDIWRWINPFAALCRLVVRPVPAPPLARYSPGGWAAVVMFLAFAGFLLADPAPSDPRRLAVFATGYLGFTALALAICGRRWLVRGEFLTVLMRTYRQTALAGSCAAGPNGWRILKLRVPGLPLAVFMLILLGSGSFDGLNETFWWFGILGINPLEFPGRSVIIGPTLLGLLSVNAALLLAYGVSIRIGLSLAGGGVDFGAAFRVFAPSILPIAAGYHVAHYLTSFLVDGQHVMSLVSSIFGLGERPVTTGFFNRLDSVRLIWFCQAGAVVAGHVIAILVAHALALRVFPDPRKATLSQLPLALFMVGYTVFGLWLLAAPKGG